MKRSRRTRSRSAAVIPDRRPRSRYALGLPVRGPEAIPRPLPRMWLAAGSARHEGDARGVRMVRDEPRMTLLWVGVFTVALGAGLLLFRRPLTTWNARGADAMRTEHIRQVTDPSDGYPRYIVGVG